MPYPVVRILEGHDRRLRSGKPWLYSNELQMNQAPKGLEAGAIVRLATQDGKAMALALFNPHSLIAARILTRNTETAIDRAFLERRVARALELRERLFSKPYYRLVNAEADGLPGIVVDRFDSTLVVQVSSAGLDLLAEPLREALMAVTSATTVVERNDSRGRELEGLPRDTQLFGAPLAPPLEVHEEEFVFLADPVGGQKTGWYFDQRDNRRFSALLGRGQTVLDLYCYAGGFGLAALASGAKSAHFVDSSKPALTLARESAMRSGFASAASFDCQDVFDAMAQLHQSRRRFGLVIAGPPPFARSRKDVASAFKAYQKLATHAASLVSESGSLCLACCSHNVPEDEFLRASYAGIRAAGRGASLLLRAGAGADHPVHPALSESAYLKFLAFSVH